MSPPAVIGETVAAVAPVLAAADASVFCSGGQSDGTIPAARAEQAVGRQGSEKRVRDPADLDTPLSARGGLLPSHESYGEPRPVTGTCAGDATTGEPAKADDRSSGAASPPNAGAPRIVAIALALMVPVCLAACGSKPAVTSLGCPSPANIGLAAGTTFGAPKVVRTGVSLSCSYRRGGTSLGLTIHKRDVSITQFRSAQQEAASAHHQTAAPLDGYGSAAYMTTSPGGHGATELTILTHSDSFTLLGTLTVVRTKAVARYLLSDWLTRHEHFTVHIPL
jgi:hypothetical protein